MSGLGVRHVRQSLLELSLEIGLETSFRRFALYQLTRCVPHDSTELK
jgi:hypothetical protein